MSTRETICNALLDYETKQRDIAASSRNAAHIWPDLAKAYADYWLQFAEDLRTAREYIQELEEQVKHEKQTSDQEDPLLLKTGNDGD